jgi:DNA-binding NarL/FixJ family response regulator
MNDPQAERPGPLRVIVADDQASVREGLMLMLGLFPDIEVVAGAADGREALHLTGKHDPDAILLDLHMPVLDGTQTARLLTEQHPSIAIVVLTTYADDAAVLAALQAGARSCLTKDADRRDIANALRSAVTGLAVSDRSIQERPGMPTGSDAGRVADAKMPGGRGVSR